MHTNLKIFSINTPSKRLPNLRIVKEAFILTTEQIMQITNLRAEGKGYRAIASELDLPLNSVKSWCRRHPLKADDGLCLQCGAEIHSIPHKRQRKFCSDKCRKKWWSEHPERRSKGKYLHNCKFSLK